MKKLKKIFSLCLILILSLTIAVSGSACSLSELGFNLSGCSGFNFGNSPSGDGEKDDADKQKENEENKEEDKTDDEGEGDVGEGEGEGEEDDKTEVEETPSTPPDNVGFYEYLSAFNAAQSTLKLDITSLKMLAAYIEYANFYTIKDKVEMTLKYTADDFNEEFLKAKAIYDESIHLSIAYSSGREYLGNKGSYFITESDCDALATKTLDPDKDFTLEQIDYAFKMTAPNERAVDYDDFKLNSIEKTLPNIKNSEQLRWAIQNGYKPVCAKDSSAESVLNSAKAVLRQIVSDEMDDITKLRAIYEWLAYNVQYDNAAAAATEIKPSEYDSWYAEGVFNHQKAVCEGYSKALIIMAGLEGIPAIIVTGNEHAWNRVLVGGKWYVLDATHADAHVSENEIFTYSQFMITDAEKANRGYSSVDYADCAATTEFNVYKTILFDYLLSEYDLAIESGEELFTLLTKAQTYKAFGKECTVCFFVAAADKENFETWTIGVSALYKSYVSPTVDLNGNEYHVFYLR